MWLGCIDHIKRPVNQFWSNNRLHLRLHFSLHFDHVVLSDYIN